MRNLGRSGLRTPPLVLGGNVFGWTVKGEDAFRPVSESKCPLLKK